MNTHQENIQQYLALGGDARKVKQLTVSNLQNRARLAYLLGQLRTKEDISVQNDVIKGQLKTMAEPPAPTPPPVRKKGVFSDFISQYPTELHETYKKRYDSWLEACSLKVKLNEVPDADSDAALIIQEQIMKSFDEFDRCQEALDYFNKNKRVLATKSDRDFSQLSPVELLTLRNNLRTNISKRKGTIKKKQAALPDPGSDDFKMKQNALSRKIEELRNLELQLKEVERLMK